MGANLTKSKSTSVSEKTKQQQQQETPTTTNHLDVTIKKNNKQIKKKIKNKKEQKSSKTKVDKSTNTDNCVLPAASFSEQLVGEHVCKVKHNSLLTTSIAQENAAYQSETPSKDVQELWDACARNGILADGNYVEDQRTTNEQKHLENMVTSAEELPNDNNRVLNEQPPSVES